MLIKNIVSIFLAVIIMAFFNVSYASGVTDESRISFINAGGNLFVRFEDGFSYQASQNNPDNCPNTGNYILRKVGNDDFDQIYTVLLMAYANQSTTRLFVDGCFGPSVNKFPEIKSIIVK